VSDACLQCGKPIPRYAGDYYYPDIPGAAPARRVGRRMGSTDMLIIDPDDLFCTLRCAARYGVAAARKVKP
jgi:hypothetical protein